MLYAFSKNRRRFAALRATYSAGVVPYVVKAYPVLRKLYSSCSENMLYHYKHSRSSHAKRENFIFT
jgi:hypothetical protein